ncbi:hypothetical protein PENTCL1PPCAC_19143, partial [Pristionchus entomophagus]
SAQMRVLVAVIWLATVASLSTSEDRAKKAAERKEKTTTEGKKTIKMMLDEQMRADFSFDGKEGQKRDGTGIKWHPISDVRRLQSEGGKMVIVRIDPIDSKGLERRLEVVVAELRARGAEESKWIKRIPPALEDSAWLRWEGVPVETEVFIVTGNPEERAQIYTGSDTFTDLLTWLLQYLPPVRPKEIKTEKEMDNFMLAAPVSLIAYVPKELGDDGAFQAFVRKIAQRHPYLPVGLVYPAEELPYPSHALSPISIYYRDEDHVFPLDEDRLWEMDDFTRDNALKKASHQFISRFPEDAAHIFSQGIDKIVFVFDALGERRGQTPSYLRELALEMRQRVVIAYVDARDERMNGVREFFGVEPTENTDGVSSLQYSMKIRGFDARTERQYWPDERLKGETFQDVVETFVRDIAANKLKPHRKVEEIDPSVNAEGATIKLNADTFVETALSPSLDVVVCFFATWCPHSKRFIEKLLRAGDESKGKRKVLFTLLDVERNDVETKNKIRLFPTVILFRKGANEEVVYTGRRNLPEFYRWLDEEVERGEKMEEPAVEADETAKDYESPLTKKIKHDHEQQYTIDGLEHDPSVFEEGKGRKMKKEMDNELGYQLAERVLEKLKVDRPTIVDAIDRSKQREKMDTIPMGTVGGEKKKDTVVQPSKAPEPLSVKKPMVKKFIADKLPEQTEEQLEIRRDTVEETNQKMEDTVEEKENVIPDNLNWKNTVDVKDEEKKVVEKPPPVKAEL